MNKYFKLMSAALAVTALASCSDSLDLGKQDLSNLQEGEMLATIDPLKGDVGTRVAVVSGGQVVWADDDEVNVYSFDKLAHNTYVVSAGAGTDKATLTPKEGSDKTELSGKKYAVAQPEANKDVRISASEDGKTAILQAKIPNEFEWAKVQANGKDAFKLASPYWGEVAGENPFSCNFHALTAYLKLDLADIPVGTKSIMITTHEDITFNGDIEDPKDPNFDPADPQFGLDPTVLLKGGANEPLSGNFEAELVDATSKLQASGDLNAKDYFRINFDLDLEKDKLFYIPVIAQKYKKLYVIAVTEYGKSKYAIREGEILKVYENEEFEVGVAKSASLGAEEEFNGTNPLDLSKLIAQKWDGKHTVRVRVTGVLDAGDILIANNMLKNNVQILFDVQQTNAIRILEAKADVAHWMTQFTEPYNPANPTENGAKARTVSLIFNEGANAAWAMYLPTSYVDINTMANFTAPIRILAAKSDVNKPMSGARDVEAEAVSGLTANKAKDAPIVLHSSADAITTFVGVQILPESKSSAAYIYGPYTEINELAITTKNPGAIRLTDALVNTIAYEDDFAGAPQSININSNIFTDGSAAIKALLGGTDKAHVQPDWTGKALTKEAVASGYDQPEVFTAAQLASLGTSQAVYNYAMADRVTDVWLGGETYPWIGATVAQLDADLVPLPDYVPVGQPFTFDGKDVAMYNMCVSIDDPYFSDPHSCCTTCDDGNDVKVEDNLGLIRGVYTTQTATIKNIKLNDVLIDTKSYKIPNVGSIAGTVYANSHVNLENNKTTNIRISNTGRDYSYAGAELERVGNAGGQVGFAYSAAGNIRLKSSVIEITKAETDVDETFVKTVGHNAGGFIGLALADNGTLTATSNSVKLDEVSAKEGSNVGGIVGQLNYAATAGRVSDAKVVIPTLFATELAKEKTSATHLNTVSGNNVGGLIGYMINPTANTNLFAIVGKVNVKATKKIQAENQFAGGLVGKAQMLQDGLQDNGADNTILEIGYTTTDKASVIGVEVATLEATNGFAGGLVAANTGEVWVVNDYLGTGGETSTVDVTIGSLNTAFAGGGLIGENDDFVKVSAQPDGDHVNMTVNSWDNTWDGVFENLTPYAEMSSTTLNKLCGTFAHGVGHQTTKFDIYSKNVNGGEYVLIPNNVKEALWFKKHTDATNTVGVSTDPFWGDFCGYVGFSNKTSVYLVNGSNTHGDQLFNYRHAY